jgi:hypothetical protein
MPQQILAFILVALLASSWAQAEEVPGSVSYVSTLEQTLCKSPGGPKTGELYLGTSVVAKEQRGDWVLVAVEGWVRAASLQSAPPAQKPAREEAPSPLVVGSFSTRHVTEGVPQERVYLDLVLKNNSPRPVAVWKAALVGEDRATGELLLREVVSDDSAAIPVGGQGQVSFFWEPHERAFNVVLGATPAKIQFRLIEVEID